MAHPEHQVRRMRIGRFVVPCLLLLLHERSAHAYDLLKGLERLTGDASVDPSVVYRRLQQMEQRGWVRSAWDDDSLGPPRKVYHLTDEGDHQLRLWVQDVEELSQLLHAMVLEYQEHMETGVGAHH